MRSALFVDKHEEKCLVLDDRPAETPAKLIPVFIILRNAIKVVEPVAGIQCGIAVVPKQTAAELIGSRPCHHLHLPGAPFRLGIDWSSDDADFLDQVGTDKIDGIGAMVVPAVRNDEAISRRIDRAGPPSCKIASYAAGGLSHQIDYLAAGQGKVAHFVFGKHRAQRRGRGRYQCVGCLTSCAM